MLEGYKISDLYSMDEYTEIEIAFNVLNMKNLKYIDEKIAHIYPKGEEFAKLFTREYQSTDQVLFV